MTVNGDDRRRNDMAATAKMMKIIIISTVMMMVRLVLTVKEARKNISVPMTSIRTRLVVDAADEHGVDADDGGMTISTTPAATAPSARSGRR